MVAAILVLVGCVPTTFAQTATTDRAIDLVEQLPDLVERVHPAVVQIFTTSFGPRPGDPASFLGQELTTGAGVIVDPSGYIVTNNHVVEGARRVQVMLAQPRAIGTQPRSVVQPRGELLGAQVVGTDLESDLALLKVDGAGLPWLEFGDSEEVRQGQLVFAFGSPLGLGGSVSMGVVSAVARQLTPDDAMIYVQSDVAVNPGNSGGPLVDARGRVIGINSFILTQSGGSEGLSFAIPSNIVRTVVDQIRSIGRVRRGTIGVFPQTISPLHAEALSLPQDWGVILGDVLPGSPAEKAGLRAGDVVLRLDGKIMENGRQLRVNLYSKRPGERVELAVVRDGAERTFAVDVAERTGDPRRFADLVDPRENTIQRLGIVGLDLDREIASMFAGLRSERGVVVAGVLFALSSLGDALLPGDVIRGLNGTRVADLDDLRRALQTLVPGDPAVLQVERQGRFEYVALQIES